MSIQYRVILDSVTQVQKPSREGPHSMPPGKVEGGGGAGPRRRQQRQAKRPRSDSDSEDPDGEGRDQPRPRSSGPPAGAQRQGRAGACWVCLDDGVVDGESPLHAGCGCRGEAGHAHPACLAAAAAANPDTVSPPPPRFDAT